MEVFCLKTVIKQNLHNTGALGTEEDCTHIGEFRNNKEPLDDFCRLQLNYKLAIRDLCHYLVFGKSQQDSSIPYH